MKQYQIHYNVGTVKYLVSFHDGVKTHPDGTPFFDVRTFRSKNEMQAFIRKLQSQEYTNTFTI